MRIANYPLLAVLPALLLWTGICLASDEEAAEKERISRIAQETLVEVQARVKAANKMDYEEREAALDKLLFEVVAPLIHNVNTMAEFFGEHWAEIQRLGLQERASEAALTLLKDNYMFVIERSDRAKVELRRVVLDSPEEASALFRVHLRKRIPVEVELRSNDKKQWRIHDLIMLRRSIRSEVSEAIRRDIQEKGPQGAFDAILNEE